MSNPGSKVHQSKKLRGLKKCANGAIKSQKKTNAKAEAKANEPGIVIFSDKLKKCIKDQYDYLGHSDQRARKKTHRQTDSAQYRMFEMFIT